MTKARELGCGPDYVVSDIRQHQPSLDVFDAAIVMGQSFGHFDAATNRAILFALGNAVRKRSRLTLDLWIPEFFEAHQDERDLETSRGVARETKRV